MPSPVLLELNEELSHPKKIQYYVNSQFKYIQAAESAHQGALQHPITFIIKPSFSCQTNDTFRVFTYHRYQLGSTCLSQRNPTKEQDHKNVFGSVAVYTLASTISLHVLDSKMALSPWNHFNQMIYFNEMGSTVSAQSSVAKIHKNSSWFYPCGGGFP